MNHGREKGPSRDLYFVFQTERDEGAASGGRRLNKKIESGFPLFRA